MSLKVFHIFFIIVSVLFGVGFGVWALHSYFQHDHGTVLLWLGLASFLVAAVLIFYGIKIFQKLQNL